MENILDDLQYRGLIQQYSDEEKVREILSSPTTVYCGFDPSASSMHLGNFVMISLLMRFQKAGHRVVALVGGGTGMIGDPSGKSKERNLQDAATLAHNTQCLKEQLSRFLDFSDPNKGIMVDNADWLTKMNVIEFLRDYGKYFPINYMLSKEIVASRLESGISFTEFSYQILQSLDFYKLHHEHGVAIQLGGNDQWGNLTSGLELIRKLDGDSEKVAVMTCHLITRSDGKKFGKSEKGALFLDKNLTSPYFMYQYLVNTTDEDCIKYLKVFTFLSKDEIEDVAREHFAAPGARIGQKKLAYEVVAKIFGKEEAEAAVSMTNALFSGNVKGLSESQIEETLGSLKVHLEGELLLEDLLIKLGIATSKRDARTLISGNSISLNGDKVTDLSKKVSKEDALYGRYLIVRKGKKQYSLGEF